MGTCTFFNMTNQPIALTVNDQPYSGGTLAPISGTAPYTPNSTTTPYALWDSTAPEPGQIGTTNTILAVLSGGSSPHVEVTFNIDMGRYPVTSTILVYIFYHSMVAEALTDGTAYVGPTGQTLDMAANSKNQQL
jgi:hypothetical protein